MNPHLNKVRQGFDICSATTLFFILPYFLTLICLPCSALGAPCFPHPLCLCFLASPLLCSASTQSQSHRCYLHSANEQTVVGTDATEHGNLIKTQGGEEEEVWGGDDEQNSEEEGVSDEKTAANLKRGFCLQMTERREYNIGSSSQSLLPKYNCHVSPAR